jgi:CBS domain-containing protein
MTPKVLSCHEDETITQASLVMERNLVRRLVVLDRNDKLVGIVSLDDFAAKVKNESLVGYVLSKVAAA